MIGLQLNITPTDRYATVEGVPCQVWEGRTPLGSACLVYVAWVDVPHGQDTREFDALGLEDAEGPAIGYELNGAWNSLAGATSPILPPGNPARGGKRDEEEDTEGQK